MTESNLYSNYLAHHGVLGMKWGVRRSQNQLSKNSSNATDKKLLKQKRKQIKNGVRDLRRLQKMQWMKLILMNRFKKNSKKNSENYIMPD